MAQLIPPRIPRVYYVYSSQTELVVAWELPATPCNRFQLQYSPRYLGRWHEWDDSYTVPLAVITDLEPANRYTVRVRPHDPVLGWGDWTVCDLDLWTTMENDELPPKTSITHVLQLMAYHEGLKQSMRCVGAPRDVEMTISGPVTPLGSIVSSLPPHFSTFRQQAQGKLEAVLEAVGAAIDCPSEALDPEAPDSPAGSVNTWWTAFFSPTSRSSDKADSRDRDNKTDVKDINAVSPTLVGRYGNKTRKESPRLQTSGLGVLRVSADLVSMVRDDTTALLSNLTIAERAQRISRLKHVLTECGVVNMQSPKVASRAAEMDMTCQRCHDSLTGKPKKRAQQHEDPFMPPTSRSSLRFKDDRDAEADVEFGKVHICGRCSRFLCADCRSHVVFMRTQPHTENTDFCDNIDTTDNAGGAGEKKFFPCRVCLECWMVAATEALVLHDCIVRLISLVRQKEREYNSSLPFTASFATMRTGSSSSILADELADYPCPMVIVPESGTSLQLLGMDAALAFCSALQMFNSYKDELRLVRDEKCIVRMYSLPIPRPDSSIMEFGHGCMTWSGHGWGWIRVNKVLNSDYPEQTDPADATAITRKSSTCSFDAAATSERTEEGESTTKAVTPAVDSFIFSTGLVVLPPASCHPATTVRAALRRSATLLEFMTLLQTYRDAVVNLQINRVNNSSPARRRRSSMGYHGTVGSTLLQCTGLKGIDSIRDVHRQAITDLSREPGLILDLCEEAQRLFFSDEDCNSDPLALLPGSRLEHGGAPWLRARPAASTIDGEATASSTDVSARGADQGPIEPLGVYFKLGSEAAVDELQNFLMNRFHQMLDNALLSTLPPADRLSSMLAEAFSDLEEVKADDVALLASAFREAVVAAMKESVEAYVSACMVLCSRTTSGGDAHAYAHEIFGNAGKQGDNPMMRSLVVLRHVQPTNWGSLGVASIHTAAPYAPLTLRLSAVTDEDGGADVATMCISTVDLYQLIDLHELEGTTWAILQTKIDHTVRFFGGRPFDASMFHAYEAKVRDLWGSRGEARCDVAFHEDLVTHFRSFIVNAYLPKLVDSSRLLSIRPVGKAPGELRIQLQCASNIGELADANREQELEDSYACAVSAVKEKTESPTFSWLSAKKGSPLQDVRLGSILTKTVWKALKAKGIEVDVAALHACLPIATGGAKPSAPGPDSDSVESRSLLDLSSDVGVGAAIKLGVGLSRNVPWYTTIARNHVAATTAHRRYGTSTVGSMASPLEVNLGSVLSQPAGDSLEQIALRPCVYAILRAGSSEIETAVHELNFTADGGKDPFAAVQHMAPLVVPISTWTPSLLQALLPKLQVALSCCASVPGWKEGVKLNWDGVSAVTISLWFVPPGATLRSPIAHTKGATAASTAKGMRSRSTSYASLEGACEVISGAEASGRREHSVAGHVCLGTATMSLMSLSAGIPETMTVPVTTRVHVSIRIPDSFVQHSDLPPNAAPAHPPYEELVNKFGSVANDASSVQSLDGSDSEDALDIIGYAAMASPTQRQTSRGPRPSVAAMRRLRARTVFAGNSIMESSSRLNKPSLSGAPGKAQPQTASTLTSLTMSLASADMADGIEDQALQESPQYGAATVDPDPEDNIGMLSDIALPSASSTSSPHSKGFGAAPRNSVVGAPPVSVSRLDKASIPEVELFETDQYADIETGVITFEVYYWHNPTKVLLPPKYLEKQERRAQRRAAKAGVLAHQ